MKTVFCLSPHAPRPHVLTEREREVVARAAAGEHNKLIAYNLGISHSTVRVLMARAIMKSGARSRADLIRRYASSLECRAKGASLPGSAESVSCEPEEALVARRRT